MAIYCSKNREQTTVLFPFGTVKEAKSLGINVSKICQGAIKKEIRRIKRIKEKE